MKFGLYTLTALLAGAGMALAQVPMTTPPQTTVPPGATASPVPPGETGIYVGDVNAVAMPAGLDQPPVVDPVDDPSYTLWFSAEYLLWHMKRAPTPPLQILQAGALQLNSTTTVVNQNGQVVQPPVVQPFLVPIIIAVDPGIANGPDINIGYTNGSRLTLGGWFDPNQDVGFEARGFFFEKQPFYFNNTTSSVNTNVQLPFVNRTIIQAGGVAGGQPETQDLPILLDVDGRVVLAGKATNQFSGAEANFRGNYLRIGALTFDGLVGVRNLNLKEELEIVTMTALTATPEPPIPPQPGLPPVAQQPVPITLTLLDRIRTRNHFVGAQVGTQVEGWMGRFFVNGRAVVGFGGVHQIIKVDNADFSLNFNSENLGGLLTGLLDVGRRDHDKAAVMTDFEVKAGFLVLPGVRIFAGYDWLNITHFTRPGDAVRFTTTTTQVQIAGTEQQVSVSQPGFTFFDSELWVQGLSFGLELRY